VVSKPVARKWLPWIVAPIGFEVGFSSAGAGALGTVALMRFTTLLPSEVVGTDLAFGLLLSVFAGGIHASMSGTQLTTVVAPQNAPGALRLADLHRRTNLLARHPDPGNNANSKQSPTQSAHTK
jgi:uncharacterized membrane protein YfcA